MADQAQGGVADRGRHAAHLAVATLGDGELDPGGGNGGPVANRRVAGPDLRLLHTPGGCRGGEPIPQFDSRGESFQRFVTHRTLHLNPVSLWQFVARVADGVLERAGVGQQQQTLAVPVKPPGRVDAGERNVVTKRRAPLRITELGQDTIGLVESDQTHGGIFTHTEPL